MILLQIYVVKSGDSLYRIARRFGIPLEDLVYVNQLERPGVLVVGQALLLPDGAQTEPQRRITVNGYVTNVSRSTLEQSLPPLTFLSVFSYRTDAEGRLTKQADAETSLSGGFGVQNLMTVTNLQEGGGFSSEIAHAVLTRTDAQDALTQNVLQTLEREGYSGVNLDLEYVYPSDRTEYNRFLTRMADALHRRGFVLVSALAPKTSDDQQGLLYEAHDYAFHGQVSDYCVLMTYEWGYTYGPPMAVSPLDKVRGVLDYAVTEIPRGKILMGVPNYGYDWTLPYRRGTRATPLSNVRAVTLAGETGAEIAFDETAQAPYFRYADRNGRRHEVWFEDARSLRAKLALLNEYGLGGVSYWNLNRLFRTIFYTQEADYETVKR